MKDMMGNVITAGDFIAHSSHSEGEHSLRVNKVVSIDEGLEGTPHIYEGVSYKMWDRDPSIIATRPVLRRWHWQTGEYKNTEMFRTVRIRRIDLVLVVPDSTITDPKLRRLYGLPILTESVAT